ncbi:DUF5916 domain-containing protein [uncultured Draconibacterium sp.]|uniref:DUF5916 domain-containing protein n=1 Tax=uncultured Draconibacterium sp. TaxID=1573823 RepID=UPI0029C74AFE|nr:DUF5916 domain-containing protein [uncultured Draconibacterium sp.]
MSVYRLSCSVLFQKGIRVIRSFRVRLLLCSLLCLFLYLPVSVYSQDSQRNIFVKYIQGTIILDGKLDEPEWQTAGKGGNFWQFFPSDSARAMNNTEFRLMYNDNMLYIGIRAEAKSDNFIVSSLRRDFGGTSNDNVTLMFDTFKDGTTAFLFGMTPYGVQREVFVSGGGSQRNSFNNSWDQKWQVESTMHDDYYVLEAAVPFSSVKFREGEKTWRVQCYRWDMQTNEQSAWARVPQNQMLSSLAFMGTMEFEKPLGKSHTPFTIIPYMNTLASKDYSTDSKDSKFSIGGDAKVAIGNSMNLDITVNPDFSNVEVDDIFTNLTRFEVFLPEKRQFFIDNNDLFGSYGDAYGSANPFFSRRIGLARDASGNMIENRIIGGVRLSGKLNDRWRLGFLNMQTEEDTDNEIASNNNMMFTMQRKMFARSSLGFFAVNRQTFGDYDFLDPENEYNRVLGLDYNLASADNSWTGKFYVHKSLQPDDTKGNYSWQTTATYNPRKFKAVIDLRYVDEDFRADLGFIPRLGIFKSGNEFNYIFYPSGGKISRHSPGARAVYYWRPNMDWKQTDRTYSLLYDINFANQSSLRLNLSNEYVFLTRDFDPTRTPGAVPLPGNEDYSFNTFSVDYQSNPAKVFSFSVESEGGGYYNGHSFTAGTELTYRFQPWVLLSLNTRYDALRLPDPHADADFWLVTPKVDITFSKSVFWSTLVQYSNQRENLGINSRLQWRFAPLSDLYLVYNDNYFTKDFGPKFRSINLKISYWLNI